MKRKGKLWISLFSGIFVLVGVALLVGGAFAWIYSRKFQETAVEVTAVITDIDSYRDSDGDRHHNVYVEYGFNGRQYRDVRLNFYNSGMYEGKEIAILCDPDNPGHIEAKGGLTFLYALLMGMGILFAVIGAIPAAVTVKNTFNEKKIRNSGRKLYAVVEEIVLNTSLSLNGQHPYLIYCIYRDEYSDKIYRFKSGSVWTNPNPVVRPGDTVPVFVDERNFRHYYVDVESLLQGRIEDYT